MHRRSLQLFSVAIVVLVASVPARAADLFVTDPTPFTGPRDYADGICTLDEAVLSANTNGALGSDDCGSGEPGFDRVILAPGTYTLLPSVPVFADGLGALRESIHLAGAGAGQTVLLAADRGGTPVAVDSAAPPVEVALTDLALRGDGRLEGFRGIDLQGSAFTGSSRDLVLVDAVISDFDEDTGSGGAILTTVGNLTLLRSSIENNSARNGGGLFVGSSSTVLIQDTTVRDNRAVRGLGGGLVLNSGTLATILNSTIARNTALSVGGLFATSMSVIEIGNSTVSENGASMFTGGIRTFAATTLRNSIVLANVPDDCFGFIQSADYNLVGLGQGCPAVQPGDQTVDPSVVFTEVLAPLAMNGGLTATYEPLAAGPAVDAGDPAGCTDLDGSELGRDQAGAPRPVDGDGDGLAVCDVGSVELQRAVSPEERIGGLLDSIEDLRLPFGTSIALQAQLRNALRNAENGRLGAAINGLRAFIRVVEAQRGKKIPAADADALIAETLAVMEALSAMLEASAATTELRRDAALPFFGRGGERGR